MCDSATSVPNLHYCLMAQDRCENPFKSEASQLNMHQNMQSVWQDKMVENAMQSLPLPGSRWSLDGMEIMVGVAPNSGTRTVRPPRCSLALIRT